ncbi:MAG: NADH-quinone oxidoreductase subunit NuoN [Acidobacteria bacterium]|nr:NADH-quinone oxidoreductase subunit NuoN [Acidobacteriota bacterium]
MESIPFSASDLAALNAEITLTIGACIVLVWGAFAERNNNTGHRFAWITLLTVFAAMAGVTIGLPALMSNGVATAFAGQLAVDGFGSFFSALFLVAAALAIGASFRFLDDEDAHAAEYYFFMLTSLVGMMIMARAADLISLFVGLELQALSVYVLVGYLKSDRRSSEAGVKYFILGGLSSGVFVYALSLIYAITGTTNIEAIRTSLNVPGTTDNPILILGLILLVVSLAFKVAAVPFHMWAPDAYSGAPTPVSMFISVASKAAAFAMMIRLLFVAFEPMTASWTALLAVLSVATMTFGNVAAVTQDNVKRMFAYSSVAHAGYALMGIVAGTAYGVSAAMYYLFAYTFMNIGAWAMIVIFRREGMACDRVEDFNGLVHRSGWAAAAMIIFLLSLGGIPPTIGFLGKWYVFGAAVEAGYGWLAVVGAINAAISIFYYLRLVKAMFVADADSDVTLVHSMPLNVTLALSAVITILGVIWATPFIEWVQSATLPF